MADDKLMADVLRAAGWTDAAVLVEKLSAATAPAATAPADEAPAQTFGTPEEAERHAAGEEMLAVMKRDLPGFFR